MVTCSNFQPFLLENLQVVQRILKTKENHSLKSWGENCFVWLSLAEPLQ